MSNAADNRIYREPATIGHNSADIDPIAENLRERNAQLLEDAESLLDDAALSPEKLETEQQSKDLSDLIKRINDHRIVTEEAHTVEKEPYLTGGRSVDDFFRKPVKDLKDAAAALKAKVTVFLKAEDDKRLAELRKEEERKRALAEAEAVKARELAAAGKKEDAIMAECTAAAAEKAADKLEQKIESGEVVAKSVGSVGTASLRKTWVGEVTSRDTLDLGLLRQYLSDDVLQKALSAYVKNGGRSLHGAKIYDKTDAVVR